MAVKWIARLEAQAIACTQAGQLEPSRSAGGQHRLGERDGITGRMIKFETVFARIAGPADQAVDAGDRALGDMVILHEPKLRTRE